MNKWGKFGLIAGSGMAALTAGCFVWKNRRLILVNDITTGESAAYPELRSRVYYADTARILVAAEQAMRRLPGWKLVSLDAENDEMEAEARRFFGRFTCDVTLYAIALGHGQTRVTLRSRSRQGGGDWGQNAAHIRRLQQAMDDRLNTEAAF